MIVDEAAVQALVDVRPEELLEAPVEPTPTAPTKRTAATQGARTSTFSPPRRGDLRIPFHRGEPMQPNSEISLEQDLLFAMVKEKYGHLLTEEQLEGVRAAVLRPPGRISPVTGNPPDQRRRALYEFQALPRGLEWLTN